jgi:pilus assembly protein CpaB
VRTSTIVMIGVAVLFGLFAVFLAQSWLNGQAEMRLRNLEAQKKPAATQTIVVATKPLRFGNELSSSSLREIAWPEESIPAGAFRRIADIVDAGGRRVVLSAIESNEPVLSTKITGPGQRATLSATLQDGMRAVTIRVNDVEGVAGFVLPEGFKRQQSLEQRCRAAEYARLGDRPDRR